VLSAGDDEPTATNRAVLRTPSQRFGIGGFGGADAQSNYLAAPQNLQRELSLLRRNNRGGGDDDDDTPQPPAGQGAGAGMPVVGEESSLHSSSGGWSWRREGRREGSAV
jgi:hypothetical protein